MIRTGPRSGVLMPLLCLALSAQGKVGPGKVSPTQEAPPSPERHPVQRWIIHRGTPEGRFYFAQAEALKTQKGIGPDYTFELTDLFDNDEEIAADMTPFYQGIPMVGCTVRLVYDKKQGRKLIQEDVPVFPRELVQGNPKPAITADQARVAAIAYRPRIHGMPYFGDEVIEAPFLVWIASYTKTKRPTENDWDYTRTVHSAQLAYLVPFEGRVVLVDALSGAPIKAYSTAIRS